MKPNTYVCPSFKPEHDFKSTFWYEIRFKKKLQYLQRENEKKKEDDSTKCDEKKNTVII